MIAYTPLTTELLSVYNGIMSEPRKELRVTVPEPTHEIIMRCAQLRGYSSLSEFVRVAIVDKIHRDCPEMAILVSEVLTQNAPDE